MYALSDYHFDLPEELIANTPKQKRDESRLMCLERETGHVQHRVFSGITEYLEKGDLLVMNNTRVVPARLHGRKDTGGKAEVLILDYPGGMAKLTAGGYFECECLIKTSKHLKKGAVIWFDDDFYAESVMFENGIYTLRFHSTGDFEEALVKKGVMPLPPYIRRTQDDPALEDDRKTYQTVYAREKGAVAAPTAGLHFTEALLGNIRENGVETVAVTLHVGYGTFVPVRVSDIREHIIHSERYHVPTDTAIAVNQAKADGRRVIAVGTTTVRTLEHVFKKHGRIEAGAGVCDLFIYPGYTFSVIDAMITNFHIPESSLLMLVSAFAGFENIRNAYETAVRERYRFYSYGDSMFIR